MKQSNKNRQNGRHMNGRFGNNRHSGNSAITRNTAFDSSSVAGRVRGTAQQLIDKYLSLAKDAKAQDDRVLHETYLQYADHYARMLDIAIQNEQARMLAAQQQQAQRMAAMAATEEQSEPAVKNEEVSEPEKTEVGEVKKSKHGKPKMKKVPDNNPLEPDTDVGALSLPVTDSLPLASEGCQNEPQDATLQPVMIEIPE